MIDYAWNNLLRRKGRTLLTIVGISVLTALVTVISGIVSYNKKTMNQHAAAGVGRLVVQSFLAGKAYPTAAVDMPEALSERILSLPNLLGLLDAPSSGRLLLQGEPVASFSDRRLTALRKQHIGFVFQSFCLIPTLTAVGNVAMPLRLLGLSKRRADARAAEALAEVGLEKRLGHLPNELSGGERQRVAIARAVVKNPRYILADEPTGNLDSETGFQIVSILRRVVERQGTTVVQVTHDQEIGELSDRVLTLKDGRLIH
jgi:putative ABC transport system ATP-binding protein